MLARSNVPFSVCHNDDSRPHPAGVDSERDHHAIWAGRPWFRLAIHRTTSVLLRGDGPVDPHQARI